MLDRLWRSVRQTWPTIRVVSSFMVTIFVAFSLLTFEPLVQRFDISWALAQTIAWASWGLLAGLGWIIGFPVSIAGTHLFSGAFRVDVSPACSGAVPSMIYLAAVFAYPASGRAKALGAAIGLLVIHGANLLRVMGLFLIGLFAEEYFHHAHVYVAQGLVVAIAVATWLYWAGRFVDAPGR